ncbi:MAG: FAD-dependent monooxygenase [Pseudonocardiaceae bacterium]
MTVVIVGAGPVGLAVACGLRQHGIGVRVVDRAPGPSPTSRANIVHARGAAVLDRLGALGDLPARSVTAMKITMHLEGRPVTTVRFGDAPGAARAALVVSQAEVESRLRARLAELGGRIEWETELVGLSQEPDGVVLSLGGGETVRAAWVIGCDGAHSAVRDLSGIAFPGAPVAEQFLLADVHADWAADRGGTAGWYSRQGLLFAMPMRDPGGQDDLWRLMADVSLAEPRPADSAAVLDRFRELLPERAGRTDVRIRDAVWTSVFRIHRRLAEDYRRGRVLLAGDAAHIHSPMGGQGMNTGIGDAENLAWKLALVIDGHAHDALLNTYRAERRPLAVEVLRGSTMATRIQVGKGPIGRFLRDRVMIPLLNLPWVQARMTAAAAQLWVSYRRGPLGGGPRVLHRRQVRSGDRVPDRPCRYEDGQVTRLYAELRGRWVLLADSTDAALLGPTARKWLGDHVAVLHPSPGETGSQVQLVRPDGHLGWQGPADPDLLGRWLTGAMCHGRTR